MSCPLSPRQYEVVSGLCAGEIHKQIARRLGISLSTVRTHAHVAYGRLGVANAAQAVAVMVREGWFAADDLPSYEGPAYSIESQRGKRNRWLPSPAQRLYLNAFDRLLMERSDEAADRLDECFAVMCGERGVPDRRRSGRSVDSMLLKVARALVTRDVPMAA